MKVNEKFPNWMTSGGQTPESYTGFISNVVYPYFYAQDKPVFRYPYSANVFPSVTVGTNAQWLSSLDVMFAMKYGERRLRKIVEPFILHNKSTESVTVENVAQTNILAQMINERFADKWNHIADALEIDYEPLENYNRNEDSSFQHSNTGEDYNEKTFPTARKDTTSIAGGWTDADTRATATSGKYSKKTTTADSINGFNGGGTFNTAGQPSGYSEVNEGYDYTTGGAPYTETNSGNIKRDYHGKTNSSDYTETVEHTGSEKDTHHINNGSFGWDKSKISGNIVVTTSQQMLESELEVRKNLLYDIILSDIAEFLTISVY